MLCCNQLVLHSVCYFCNLRQHWLLLNYSFFLGGNFRTVASTGRVVLNGSDSKDLDLPPFVRPQLSFLWTCMNSSGILCKLRDTLATKSVLNISASSITGGTLIHILLIFIMHVLAVHQSHSGSPCCCYIH